ncbi:MAG: hypothetical protein NWS22_05750 [Porticoccaceae bacterium]|nr:hypothetical protein [Porticoccaceae bacterium]
MIEAPQFHMIGNIFSFSINYLDCFIFAVSTTRQTLTKENAFQHTITRYNDRQDPIPTIKAPAFTHQRHKNSSTWEVENQYQANKSQASNAREQIS